jgi:hypothetical protein
MGYLFSWLSLSKTAAETGLNASEILIIAAGLILTLGAIGEYAEERHRMPCWCNCPALVFILMVVGGLIGEFVGDGGVFLFSGVLQTISDGELAGVRAEAATANKAAGLAREHAENANALAKRYQAQISDSNARAKEADARALEAELALARLKAPRTLTDKQLLEISKSIKFFAGQEFELSTVMGGTEPTAFADRIYKALIGGRWKFVNPGGYRNVFGTNGVTVMYNPGAETRVRDAASSLASALDSHGVKATLAKDESTPANRVRAEISDEPIKTARP